MVSAGEIFVKLGLDTADFKKGVDDAKTSLVTWRDNVNGNTSDLAKWGAALAVETAPLIAIGYAMLDAANRAGEFGKAIKDNARDLGLTTDEYQRWTHAAIAAGSSASEITSTFRMMSIRMKDAADPTSDMGKQLAAIGVSATDSNGRMKSMNDLLGEILPALNKLPEGFERNQASMAIFGRSWSNIADLASLSIEQLEELRNQAPVIDEDKIQKMDQFKVKMALVNEQWEYMYADIGTEIIPVIEEFLPLIQDYLIPSFAKLADVLEMSGRGFHIMGEESKAATQLLKGDLTGALQTQSELSRWVDNKSRDDRLKAAGFDTDGMGNVIESKKLTPSDTNKDLDAAQKLIDKYSGLNERELKYQEAVDAIASAQIEYNDALKGTQEDLDKASIKLQRAKNDFQALREEMAKTATESKTVSKALEWSGGSVVGSVGSEMQLFLQKEMEAGTDYQTALNNWQMGAPSAGPAEGTLAYVQKQKAASTKKGEAAGAGTPAETATVTTEKSKQVQAITDSFTKITTAYQDNYAKIEKLSLTHWTAESELARITYQHIVDAAAQAANYAGSTPIIQKVVMLSKSGYDIDPSALPAVKAPKIATADFSGVTFVGGAGATTEKEKDKAGTTISYTNTQIFQGSVNKSDIDKANSQNQAKIIALGGALN